MDLAHQYRRLNNDNVFTFRDGSDDVVLDRDACDANQKAFRLERQASGNRLAAIVRRGMQLNARKLHQPQPPEADSAAAQRAQDPEDDKGLRVTLVPNQKYGSFTINGEPQLFHATFEEMMKEMQPQLPQDVMMAEEQPHVDWEAMGATAKSNNGQGKVKGQVKGQVMKGKVKGQEQPMKGKGQEQPMKRKKLNSQ